MLINNKDVKKMIIKNLDEIKINKSGDYHLVFKNCKKVNVIVEKKINVKLYEIDQGNNDVEEINYIIDNNSFVQYNSLNLKKGENFTKKINFELYLNSKLTTCFIEVGSDATAEYNINLNAKNGNVKFNLIDYCDELISHKHNVTINHLSPYTYSAMENYAVLNNGSECIFDVVSFVEKNSYKAEAYQTSKMLTLTNNCKATINPQLLINEHDVLGSHAASYGKVEEEVIYYMQSRGLNENEINRLIILGHLLKNVPTELKDIVVSLIERRVINE